MSKGFGVLVATSALVFGSSFSAVALADAAPIPGTDDCTALVENNAQVKAALANQTEAAAKLNATPADDPNFEANQNAVTEAGTALDQARATATQELCTGTVTEPTTTTNEPPATTTPPETAESPVFTDDKDCSDFASQDAAQAYFLSHRSSAQPDPDQLDSNNNGIACESAADDSSSSSTSTPDSNPLDPTDDDDSNAVVDGSQVVTVPEGSASTGGGF